MGRIGFRHGAIALLLGLLLSACSGPSFNFFGGQSQDEAERNRWRDEAEMQCLGLKGALVTAFVERKPSIDGPGVCGIRQPFALSSVGVGLAEIKPAATLNCQMVVAVQHWMRSVVQPAALIRFGQPVVEVKNIASYGCRSRNNARGAKLSEHSFGNALDVAAFKLAGGREISVKEGWNSFFGLSREAGFLRAVHRGSCDVFSTVLGPEADAHHADHLHLDLARHNASGTHYCR